MYYTEQIVLDLGCAFYVKYRRLPAWKELCNANSLPGGNVVKKFFGGIKEYNRRIVEVCGEDAIEDALVATRTAYKDKMQIVREDYINKGVAFVRLNGYYPMIADMRSPINTDFPSHGAIRSWFGSLRAWHKAIYTADPTLVAPGGRRYSMISREEAQEDGIGYDSPDLTPQLGCNSEQICTCSACTSPIRPRCSCYNGHQCAACLAYKGMPPWEAESYLRGKE